jgi:hypothetical protein
MGHRLRSIVDLLLSYQPYSVCCVKRRRAHFKHFLPSLLLFVIVTNVKCSDENSENAKKKVLRFVDIS